MGKMKTNQDGGSYTAKKPGAAAKQLKENEKGAAKMGYDQKFGSDRMSPSKMGDTKASELMHGAAKYYDGAGQYMNGAPKYEGAGKYNGPMDAGHGEEPGHTHELEGFTATAKRTSPVSNQNLLKQEQEEYDANTQNIQRSLAQRDSLDLVNRGEGYRAKLLYGENYDYTKKLPGTHASEGRVTQYTAKERKKQFEALKRKALNVQGPRPTQENRQFEL
jgi:hypothetical protein